jgi:hypothetical protein
LNRCEQGSGGGAASFSYIATGTLWLMSESSNPARLLQKPCVDRQEVERLSGRLDVIWPEYLRSPDARGVHHFMAFEGEAAGGKVRCCAFSRSWAT